MSAKRNRKRLREHELCETNYPVLRLEKSDGKSDKIIRLDGFKLKPVQPRTQKQSDTFDSYYSGKNLLLHGSAGTGKTFLSLYLALEDVMDNDSSFKKVILVRSIVPTRDIGFLPGDVNKKAEVYELPYQGICNELFGRGDAYSILKAKGHVEFMTTSFIRGVTFNNVIVIVDECENLSFHELDTVITRLGKNCKLIFSGDFKQSDLKVKESEGFLDFIDIIDSMKYFDTVEFTHDDIVRSSMVKEYIIKKEKLGY